MGTTDHVGGVTRDRQLLKVRNLVDRLYSLEGCGVGGPLHIVVDDGNMETSHILWCLKTFDHTWWSEDEVWDVTWELAEALLYFTEEERHDLCEKGEL